MVPSMIVILNSIFIIIGMVIMYFAIVRSSRLLPQLIGTDFKPRWLLLIRLMKFFLLGYAVTLFLVVTGHFQYISAATSVIFVIGAVFVFFAVGVSVVMSSTLFSELAERKRIESDLQKALTSRDDFISIAAHELKTPLTSISLQNQLIHKFLVTLEETPPNIQKIITMTENCQAQIERLTKLVENLLDVTRVSAGRLLLEKTKVNLAELILRISKGLEIELNKKKCKLELNLDPSVNGEWDPVRIEQIVVNLLSNAMKFGKGQPIEVSAKVEGSHAVLQVKDHGIGIAKEDQERLFNRFERAVSITSFGGLGLGLYISRQIATAHGGTIRVQSELGKGTTFILELPL